MEDNRGSHSLPGKGSHALPQKKPPLHDVTQTFSSCSSHIYAYLCYGGSSEVRLQWTCPVPTASGDSDNDQDKRSAETDSDTDTGNGNKDYTLIMRTSMISTGTDTDEYEDDISRMPMWKSYLYHLQQQAPKPKRIVCQTRDVAGVQNKPPYYGREYHGAISREDADFLLTIGGEGSYLIRESQRAPGQYTLAIRFEGVTKNFKLYYDGQHYVGEKRFDTVQDLVADGLITFYLEAKAADYIAALSSQSNYAESPYVAYNTHKKRQLAVPKTSVTQVSNTGSKSICGPGQGHSGAGHAGPPGSRNTRGVSMPLDGWVSQVLENRKSTDITQHAQQRQSLQHPVMHQPPPVSASMGVSVSHRDSMHSVVQGSHQSIVAPTSTPQQQQQPPQQQQQQQQPVTSISNVPPVLTNIAIPEDNILLDNRVSSATNTDGPKVSNSKRKSKSSPSSSLRRVERSPSSGSSTTMTSTAVTLTSTPSTMTSVTTTMTSTNSSFHTPPRSPSPRSLVQEYKKPHNFKMFEEPHFSTPPSSPPPNLHASDFKLGSVSWCTDFMEVMGSEKQHNFKLHTFKGPHWCDFCANFLWGLIAQGVKCQDCGFNAHKKCSEKVPNDCMPDMKYIKRMFGVDLTTLVKAQNTLIPVVVELAIKEIEKRGVTSEGLYRMAGFHDDVEAIKMSFDKEGEFSDITTDRYEDINTIASVLKLYFRLLPIPLITFDVYYQVIDIVRREDLSHDSTLDLLKNQLTLLPPAHYHTLKYLMAHLHRVTDHQQQNMMNSENLAIVFAPTLLRSPETDPLSGLSAVKYERALIEILILHQSVLLD